MRRFSSMYLIATLLSAVLACSSERTNPDAGAGAGGVVPAHTDGAGGAVPGAGIDGPAGGGGAAADGASGIDGPIQTGRGGADAAARGDGSGGINGAGGMAVRDGSVGTGGAGTGGRGSGGRTGGRSGGAAGGAGGTGTAGNGSGGNDSGGRIGTGGNGTGAAGGAGGTSGVDASGAGPRILWSDSIQSGSAPWGLDGFGTEHPVGTTVTPSDANGANFSVVPDPLGGAGRAIRHFATFDTGGARSQGGLYGDVNTIFGNQAKRPEGIWVAQEWFFPEAITAGGESYCWINLWDWHAIDANRGNRWHTSPGLMLARDGSMKVAWEWGGPAANINKNSGYSSIAMPVGRWFDIEMHYVWADSPSATITLWIDGQLALEQRGVQTHTAVHQIAETYLKFYGSTQGHGAWVPTPSLKYTRNVRVAGERIWR